MFRKSLIILTIIAIITVPVFAGSSGSYNYDPSSVVAPTSKYMTSSNPNVIWVDYTDSDTDRGYFLNAGTTTITTNTGKHFDFEVTGTNTSLQGNYYNFIKNWTIPGSTDYEKIENTLVWFKDNGYKGLPIDERGTGYALLELKKGHCTDYANVLYCLCQTMGIPCTVTSAYEAGISGSSSHVFNICYLDGHYYAVDLSCMVAQNGNLDNSIILLTN